MIDTHSHLLPGIDHGCPDTPTAVLMAREAADSGITTVVCTPHLPEWDGEVIERSRTILEEVKEEVANAGIVLDLRLGFEADFGIAAGIDTARLAAVTIEGSQGAILLEMPYSGWPPFIQDTIFRLSTAGFVPVLAHPERNDRVQGSSELLLDCLKAGAVAQATAGSLGGMFGRAAQRTFFRLIAEGLISLLASDAHSFQQENWTMGPMLSALAGKASPEDLLVLTDINPRRLLAGERPAAVKPENGRSPRRGRMWQKSER
jgi:protein-tyrosine phosphatase